LWGIGSWPSHAGGETSRSRKEAEGEFFIEKYMYAKDIYLTKCIEDNGAE
jgi:hypothetical protein